MTMNYLAPSPSELVRNWDVSFSNEWQPEIYPGDHAPIIRRRVAGYAGPREVVMARFGLLPSTSKIEKAAGSNVNIRAEVAATRPGSKLAFAERQWCIVPARCLYVPYLESGAKVAERWSVQRTDNTPLSMAGIWDRWVSTDGREVVSFSILTVNCDLHPLLQRFSNGRVADKPTCTASARRSCWPTKTSMPGSTPRQAVRPISSAPSGPATSVRRRRRPRGAIRR